MEGATGSRGEDGMALVLALLALLLLTVIGLTLAATSTTELQSAANYRSSRKAYYNAEAGIAVGLDVLRSVSWTYALATARTPWRPVPGDRSARQAPEPVGESLWGEPSRSYEMAACDQKGDGMGYGLVLFDGTTQYQNVDAVSDQQLDGTFTLWVRRPVIAWPDGSSMDYPRDDVLILTSEGAAPLTAPNAAISQASAVVEVTLYSSYRGVTVGPPPSMDPLEPVVQATTPFKIGSSVCQ
jgi:hypothetical protein